MTNKVLGILGGMGPLASAEFLKTIYECSANGPEQNSPVVVVYSDPTIPDRTEAFLKGQDAVILDILIRAISRLQGFGATKIVMCCMTIHHLLPRLPPEQRECILSVPDAGLSRIRQAGQRHLMLCSTGTRKLRIFEQRPQWELASQYIVFPNDADQHKIHTLIYQDIKRDQNPDRAIAFVESLLAKYQVEALAVGCSEIHLLAKAFQTATGRKYTCTDPFMAIAQGIAEGTLL